MKRGLTIFIVIAVAIGMTLAGLSGNDGIRRIGTLFSFGIGGAYQQATIAFRNGTFVVDVAATPSQRGQGLSGRPPLGSMRGMLFVFDRADRHTFWMKDMRFPLDIIWMRNGTVVEVSRNVPVPTTSIPTVQPGVESDQVLEISAGEADRLGIEPGTVAKIRFDGFSNR